MERGKLIVFEGADGSGKSSHAKRVVERIKSWMKETGKPGDCVYHREPFEDLVGATIRASLSGQVRLDPDAAAYLHVASRIEHIREMERQLAAGNYVVCDRFYLSNMAYNQTEHLDMKAIYELNKICRQLIEPDLILYLDVTLEEAKFRRKKDGSRVQAELYDADEVQRKVLNRYREIVAFLQEQGVRVSTVDAMGPREEVHARIWEQVLPVLEDRS